MKKRIFLAAFSVLSVLVILAQISVMFFYINSLQGNARVVNYAGIVRGATQRLVKNELYGVQDDAELERLDEILRELQTGKGSYELIALQDGNYRMELSHLAEQWEDLKNAIYTYREDPDAADSLYQISESYFFAADRAVDAAEDYSDGIAEKLMILKVTIAFSYVAMISVGLYDILAGLHKRRTLRQIAYMDSQTGLTNKRGCEEKLQEVISPAPGQIVCCLMFDLNNLKFVNDTYGHAVGDQLIVQFASLLRQAMPGDMFLGRLGGDEFIGVQCNANRELLKHRIEELHLAAGNTYVGNENHREPISFACGYAFSGEDARCSIRSLMDTADQNMYKNKQCMKQMSLNHHG